MKILRSNYVYMAEAGIADGGAATATTASPGAENGGESGAAASSTAATAAQSTTVLGSVANTGAELQPHERFSEKHRVFKEDGTFDLEATSLKTAEAYAALEKKLGSGELAPKTVDEYKIEKLSGEIDVAEVMADPVTKSFLARAHAKGMTNAQVQDVLDFALTEWAPSLIGSNQALNEEQCVTALREMWQSPEEYQAQTSASVRALKAYAAEGDGVGSFNRMFEKYGNDPDFIAFAARIGKEISEDSAPNLEAVLGGQTIEQLESNPAYLDPKHPDHARINKQISAYYNAKHGKAAAM